MEEICFAKMRPKEIIKRRNECPVAYIPLGTLEWHGLHNPMGADGLQAEELALRCARKGGGVVFPTVYYGESRSGSLLETDPNFREGVAKRLGLTDGELNPDRQPFTDFQQIEHYQHHLVHILAETCSYGFKLAVFVVGHYPLVDHTRAANLLYKQWVYDKPWGKMDVWAFADFQLLGDLYNNPGDHGGKWETSHLLASHPDTVDLNLATKELQYGILTTRDPINSTAAFGEEIYDAIAKRVAILVNRRMMEPEKYHGHGSPVDAAWTDS